MQEKIQNLIGGKLCPPINQTYFDNINPATGEVYAQIPDSQAEDVATAIEAAEKAFPSWSSCGQELRSKFLHKIADAIEANLDALALDESIDNGKPLSLAKSVDIPRAVSNFRFFASAILHTHNESHYTEPIAINYTHRSPLGVVGCISPWNLPLYLFTWKIAPALAAGNCVVAKPSEITPMTAYRLSQICVEVGLPAGVLNIVHGFGASVGEPIVVAPTVKAISFTGGTQTGARIAALAAPMFKKLSLELGGKNANLIFADCKLEEAVATSVRSSFANQGQICLCGSRILVEKSIYEDFKTEFIKQVKALKTGDPLDEHSNLGAVVSEAHQQKVLSYIALAQKEGGKILTGGNAVKPEGRCENGFFIEPTVIENLNQNCRTNQEEIFGPVVTLDTFDNDAEALAKANATTYGLATSVWTENLTRAHNLAQKLESGVVWINCWLLRDLRTPFGGMKQSGVGREGGFEVLKFFSEEKNICIKL
ncbi:MAG: aldehyde dehydrogenase [Bernardetiaceae bacterium]|nr:aldehyde dehydrogenase [Bernardetiaceae bacterium]